MQSIRDLTLPQDPKLAAYLVWSDMRGLSYLPPIEPQNLPAEDLSSDEMTAVAQTHEDIAWQIFIGEDWGDEFFATQEGQLLEKMFQAISISRHQLQFISGDNEHQRSVDRPPVMMGLSAAQKRGISMKEFQKEVDRLLTDDESPSLGAFVPLLHPRDLLRYPANKRINWTILQIMKEV